MNTTKTQQILEYAARRGAIRRSDIQDIQPSATLLRHLVRQGLLTRGARGVYTLPSFPVTENHTLVEVAVRHPQAVICLLSALQFHGLGPELPHQVWVAIPKASRQPNTTLPLRINRASGESMTFGIETHTLEGVPVKITSRAKTVADCLKYRNKIGLSVALEALKSFVQKRQPGDLRELHVAAKVCRVERVLKPYLEAML